VAWVNVNDDADVIENDQENEVDVEAAVEDEDEKKDEVLEPLDLDIEDYEDYETPDYEIPSILGELDSQFQVS
jgi:regulatory protein YycH of two-component signal transduction system YycFG